MATGWAAEGAVQEQIDATVKEAIERARAMLPRGVSRKRCQECDTRIPEARRRALPGVQYCVSCQQSFDQAQAGTGGINRRGSKDSQLR